MAEIPLNAIEVAPIRGGSTRYSYKVDVFEHSTDILNNTSNVTLTFKIKHSGEWGTAYEGYSTHCGILVDGIAVTSGTNKKAVGTDYVTMLTWTGDIQHDSDGGKTAVIGVYLYHNIAADYLPDPSTPSEPLTVGTITLTDIPRKSEFTISSNSYTLDVEQTFTIRRKSNVFQETLTYTCGNTSGEIEISTSDNVAIIPKGRFNPPLSLAVYSTTTTSVSIQFTLSTYYEGKVIGTYQETIPFTIPSSVAPSVSITVSDVNGYANTYGGYIKSLSALEIELTPTLAYGAEIVSYSIIANGATYPADTAITDVLKTAGLQKIRASAIDTRGRTGTADIDITVLDYTSPTIKAFRAFRCTSGGVENSKGDHIKVVFSTEITSLNGALKANSAAYTLSYKKSADTDYTPVTLTDYANTYSVSNGYYIFSADVGSSYDVLLTVSDSFKNVAKATPVSAGSVYMSRYKDSVYSLGEVADTNDADIEGGVFNVAFGTRLKGGIIPVELEYGTDLNDVRLAGFYNGLPQTAGTSNTYTNAPFETSPFTLIVGKAGEVYGTQIAIPTDATLSPKWRNMLNWTCGEWRELGSGSGGGASFTTTDQMIEGSTALITSGGVYAAVGAVEALFKTI